MKKRKKAQNAPKVHSNLKNWLLLGAILLAIALTITLAVILTREDPEEEGPALAGRTPDLSDHLTLDAGVFTAPTVDLGAYLAESGVSYDDVWDVPAYLSEYKTELFWRTVKTASTVRWNDIPEIYRYTKKNSVILEAKGLYSVYLTECGKNGEIPEFEDVETFAADYFGYGSDYVSLEDYAEYRGNDILLQEMILHRMLTALDKMPTAEELEKNYQNAIKTGGYTEKELANLARDYGEGYLWDTVRNDLLFQRALKYVDQSWVFQTPEVSADAKPTFDKSDIDPKEYTETETPTDLVKISVSSKDHSISGSFYIRLLPQAAPITVQAFQKMVKEGAYDGVAFETAHLINILTGLPKDTDRIKGEFYDNGIPNHLAHEKKVVSMFHTTEGNDSATGQFFVVLSDNYQDSLNGFFAAFGYVVAGWDTVLEIANAPTVENNKLVTPISISACFVEKTANGN